MELLHSSSSFLFENCNHIVFCFDDINPTKCLNFFSNTIESLFVIFPKDALYKAEKTILQNKTINTIINITNK